MASTIARARYERLQRYLGVVFAGLAILLALAVACLEALSDVEWVVDHVWLGRIARISLALVAAFEGARRIWLRVRRHYRSSSRADINTALTGLLVAVHNETGIPIQDLGASVFFVRRDWWAPWTPQDLERRHKVRFGGPQASPVHWVKGKGAIGLCWETNRPEHCNWYPIARRWGGSELTPDQWQKVKPAQRWGLGRDEFRSVARKYAEILAVPIADPLGGAIRGVLSIDLAMRSSHATSTSKLSADVVEDFALEAARTVASTTS